MLSGLRHFVLGASASPIRSAIHPLAATLILAGVSVSQLSCAPAEESSGARAVPPQAAPAPEPGETIFWGSYMPMVPNGHLLAHPHTGGNEDVWPFVSQDASRVDDQAENMRLALASGINGFQYLGYLNPDALKAARRVKEETGQTFYVAPQWTVKHLSADDPVAAANTVADFAQKYGDNPFIPKFKGKQIQFIWRSGRGEHMPWLNTREGVEAFNAQLKKRNVEVIVIPTCRGFDRFALDRPDLYLKSWPEQEPLQPGPLKWLNEIPWEAANGWDRHWYPPAVKALHERLATARPDFLWIPCVAAGYESSNRPGQEIRVSFEGMRTLLKSLHLWLDLGYKQLSLVTWNDPHESLTIPSSRNVWGQNAILRFFHGISASGKSPFAEPKIVVSYPTDTLVGDEFFFQVLGLPATDRGIAFRVRVELQPAHGGTPILLSGEAEPGAPNQEVLTELRWAPQDVVGKITALQPFVTVEVRESGDDAWRPLYDRLRLAPVTLNYNRMHYGVPYFADLAWITDQTELTLKADTSGLLDKVSVQARGTTPIRRLVLSDNTQSLGMFRDTGEASGDKTTAPLQDVFLRVEASKNIPLKLSVKDGTILDLFSPYAFGPEEAVVPVGQSEAVFPARPPKGQFQTRVARLDLSPDSTVTLEMNGQPASRITADLARLRRGIVAKTIPFESSKVTLGMVLTMDATDPLVDYPLPASGTFSRDVPLPVAHDGVDVLHAAALLESGQVAYSAPVVLKGGGAGEAPVPVQWIHTGGVLDDFVAPNSAVTLNPFTTDQVSQGMLPKDEISYYHLDFEEGAGSRLNDRGSSLQLGRAWLEAGNVRRDDHYEPESGGLFRWRADGRRGGGLQLVDEKAGIWFRSKSSPIGAETVSLWAYVSPAGETDRPVWRSLTAGPFACDIGPGGNVVVKFARAAVSQSLPLSAELHPGWNHFAFVYDLSAVSVYHDGKLVGDKPSKPAYQRTHRIEGVRFGDAATQGLGFTGLLDEVEIIGTGVGPREVQSLANGIPWRTATR